MLTRSVLGWAAAGAVAVGAVVGVAATRLPARGAVVPQGVSGARIVQQPPLSPAGLPGPIIWDRDQIDLAPLEVRKAWQTPAYTIRDKWTGRVVFSQSQRGGE